ncbi:hypothetical protein [Anaerorhabdus sp.]|uniref:hypothetical protein n=1 Tax=Anaerorhabdus sp. TaxID=1872524 RepID=UPI002FC76A28
MLKIIKMISTYSIVLLLVVSGHNQFYTNKTNSNLLPCVYDLKSGELSKDSPVPCANLSRIIEDGPG